MTQKTAQPLLKVERNEQRQHNEEVIATARLHKIQNKQTGFWEIVDLLRCDLLTKEQIKELADIYEMDYAEANRSVKQHQENQIVIQELGSLPKDHYDFVNIILAKWRTTMTYAGLFKIQTAYEIEDLKISEEDFEVLDQSQRILAEQSDPKTFGFKEMYQRLLFISTKVKLRYEHRRIEDALVYWMTKERNLIKGRAISMICPDLCREQVCEEELSKFVMAITDQETELVKCAIKHWIWQIKRKATGLPVKYHMMLILYGSQGIGKSTIVQNITEPLRDFTASTDFSQITDSRSHDLWDNLVLVIDEMGRSTTVNLEDIKRRLTEDQFSSRVLKTNTDTLIQNRTTMIGSSNKDISRLIFDDTGMRRFFQITCRNQIDWSITAAVNWLSIWQGVDHNKETPLLQNKELFGRIAEYQNKSRSQTNLERWFRERTHRVGIEERIQAKALYDDFAEWERTQGERWPTSMTKFGRDIKDISLVIPELEIFKQIQTGKNYYRIIYTGEVTAN